MSETAAVLEAVQYHVLGMDCAKCAAKIEASARKMPGVQDVRVSITSQRMTLQIEDQEKNLAPVEDDVRGLGYQLTRIDAQDQQGANFSHLTSAYKRALWTVVLLNLGYGVIELVGGYVSGSQAVKADALDFLGDGLITLLGVIAIGWSLTWRAQSARIQGVFLAALGLGVVANTLYRIVFQQTPEPELMGILGAIALAVNVISAVVLLPHRSGDANVRAVWLFSRNDAVGNAAVIAAAGLVAWTASPWPDIVVAAAIAGLFLHAAISIIKDANNELQQSSVLDELTAKQRSEEIRRRGRQ